MSFVRGHQISSLVDIHVFALAHNSQSVVVWRKGTLEVCTHLHAEGDSLDVLDLLSSSEVPNSVVAVVLPSEQEFTILGEEDIVNISIVRKFAIKSDAIVGNFVDHSIFVEPDYVKVPVRDVWAPFRLNLHVNILTPLVVVPGFALANKS